MTPEEFLQVSIETMAMELVDAAQSAVSVMTNQHIIDTDEPPTFDEASEYAKYAWEVVVQEPMERMRDDTGASPTELDDMRNAFLFMIRRQHLMAVQQIIRHRQSHPEEVEVDASGGYL